MKRLWSQRLRDNRWQLLLFMVGALVRVWYIHSLPPGLNQDEASVGYDAYAILHYGIDRNGVHLPVHLIAWGSGQNALYAYLAMPFLLLFGLTPLSVRALSVVMGLIGMLFFYLIMKRLYSDKTAGVAAMFFIAINPWHIMMSRWALESNLYPTIILIAVYFLIRAFDSPGWLYGFTALLALSLYAYGTSYFFVPLFAVGALALLYYGKAPRVRSSLWNAGLFVLLALPILLFIVINHYGWKTLATPLFSIPRLTMPRVEAVSSIFSGNLLGTAWDKFHVFIQLMISGSDGLPWNSISPYGFAYPLALPLAVLGLIVMLQDCWSRRHEGARYAVIPLWLLIAVLMAFITDVNINRINILFYPLIALVAVGFFWIYRQLKPAGIAFAVLFGLMFLLFTNAYFRQTPQVLGPAFYESFGDAIRYASEASSGSIYVTDSVNMPYIYVLFYEKINPHDFLETVNYRNPGDAFQQVSSFGRYVFGKADYLPGNTYVIANSDPLPQNGNYTIKQFTNYTVVIGTPAGSN
ncbi:glycosyltransferase family 39 protein [Paenibacillus sp. NFR01]|uniref:glycosyltransferase family 39 protein n=1 Tax=Paenibacillus sp. NFR01 TaxID=1566279 RepID=UPI0008CB8B5B|nr:glycosyltransferase family 39 protein [Paenibacillus sp. NFR01]SEU28919.1 Dolichyl-phosphate-mannose-protein mannosyltransferase [Paenibacillus sp. NFR01]